MAVVNFEICLAGHDSDAQEFARLINSEIGCFVAMPVLASSGTFGHRRHHIHFAVKQPDAPTKAKLRTLASTLMIREMVVTSASWTITF